VVLLLVIAVPSLALLAAACLLGRRSSAGSSSDPAALASARSGKLAADLAHISSQGASQGGGTAGLRAGP